MNKLLKFSAFTTPILVISCASLSTAQVATDVANLAGGVAAAAQTLRDGKMLSASQVTALDDAVSALQAAATAVAQASSSTSQQSATQQAIAAFNGVTAALAGVPGIPASVTTILTAAQVLLPTIEAFAGVPVTVGASSAVMTPDQANAVLADAAKKLHN